MLQSPINRYLRFTGFFFALLGATFVTPLKAAEMEEISFEDCLKEALNTHPTLMSAKSASSSATLKKENAEASFYPSTRTYLRSEMNRTSFRGNGTSGAGALANPDFSRSHAYGLEMTQNLFRGGGDKANLEKAKLSEDITRLDLENTKVALAHQVRTAFIDVLYGQELVKLNTTLKLRREENLKLVSLKHTSGQENKGSVMRSSALLTESQADLALANDLLAIAGIKLNTLTKKVNLYTKIRALGQLESFIISADLNESETLKNLPEIKIFAQKIQEAKAQVGVIESNRYPTLDLTLGANESGDMWPPRAQRLYAGLSLNYDIDLFSLRKRDRQLAQITVDKLQYDFDALKDNLRLSLIAAKYKLKEAEVNSSVTIGHLKASETQVHIARTSYNLGLKSFQEWDQLENDLVLKKKMYLANVKERAQRSADLLKETGRIR